MPDIDYVITKFAGQHKNDIRRISCETSFLEHPRALFFDDDEILADALTLYFTDYEPESCFVALAGNKVIGYIIGAINIARMNRVSDSKIIFPLLIKAFRRGVFCEWVNLKFFSHVALSAIKREFVMPDYSKDFPATFHINIDKAYRGHKIGKMLIEAYLDYLKGEKVKGVHSGTFSERSKNFFLRQDFAVLFQNKRTYFKPYINKEINFYLFGKKL